MVLSSWEEQKGLVTGLILKYLNSMWEERKRHTGSYIKILSTNFKNICISMEVIETIGTSLQWYVNIISRVVLIVECTRNIYFATSCEWSFSYIFGFALLAKLTIFTRRDYKPDMLTWTLQTTRLHKHKEIFHTFFENTHKQNTATHTIYYQLSF